MRLVFSFGTQRASSRPFVMPSFAAKTLLKPSAAATQLATEVPATAISGQLPMAPVAAVQPGDQEDMFGEFADGGAHKDVARAAEDNGFGEFEAGAPGPSAGETTSSIEFGELESTPAIENTALAIADAAPTTEEAEAGAVDGSGGVVASEGRATSLLDDMLGAALCGESIAPKKPSSQTTPISVAYVCPIMYPKLPSLYWSSQTHVHVKGSQWPCLCGQLRTQLEAVCIRRHGREKAPACFTFRFFDTRRKST